jgi:hypothetical protein
MWFKGQGSASGGDGRLGWLKNSKKTMSFQAIE